MKKIVICLAIILVGCGGGGGNNNTQTAFDAGCDNIDLTEELKHHLHLGLTVQQANDIIGCEATEVEFSTYIWSNNRTIGFGVSTNNDNLVRSIVDLEDRIKCETALTESLAEQVQSNMSLDQVDIIMNCEAQVKTIYDYEASDLVGSSVQYIDTNNNMIQVLFRNDITIGKGIFRDIDNLMLKSDGL